LQVY
jgi:hypothetical protein